MRPAQSGGRSASEPAHRAAVGAPPFSQLGSEKAEWLLASSGRVANDGRTRVSFHATVIAHPAGSRDISAIPRKLASLVSEQRHAVPVFELVPEDRFLTYGMGVSPMDMRSPAAAEVHVPVMESTQPAS